MSFENEFLDMMPYTVTVKAPTGKNAQGQPTYAGAVALPYRARIVGPVTSLRHSTKTEIAELHTLWLNSGTVALNPTYQLTLPTASPWLGRTPIIFSVNYVTDEFGMHHTKITCGFMYHRQGQT